MFQWIVSGALVLCICILHVSHRKNREEQKNKNVEALKNALLSYALHQVKKGDVDRFNFAYNTFDGTKLPPMSGCDTVNACTTYIIDKQEFKRSPWYTPQMESKLVAIDKYLDMQFDSDAKVVDFVEDFINMQVKNMKEE